MKTFILLGLLLIAVCAFAQAPEWQWAVQAGGTGEEDEDAGYSITLDDAGNSYVTGYFCGTATFGSFSLTGVGYYDDIFVAKMDTDGNWLWASQAGGSGSDDGYGITLDDTGNSYVTGYFEGTATFGAYSLTSSGDSDIFVAKMDNDGNWLWASQAGGNSDDEGYGVTIDDAGNSIVTGYFKDTATFGAYSLISSGYSDIFVAKMDEDGNWLWASQAGGTDDDNGRGITIDGNGNSYVTGYYCQTATFGSYSISGTGETDIFVAKMDVTGNWLWANGGSGSSDNFGKSIVVDDAGSSYTTGDFEGSSTFGSYTLYCGAHSDVFVVKIDTNGNWLWAVQAGGDSYDKGNSIALDDAGNCYVTGCFSESAMFDPYIITGSGYFDVFVAKMDADGNWLWAIQAGGTGLDEGYGITTDDVGNYYVTGVFEGTATFGSYSIYSNGETDVFVAKLGSILSTENDILSFQIPEQIGETIIDDVEHTVQLDVPSGTNVTALIPTIEISDFATIYPESGTPQDFTQPVEYTVTAQNGDEQIWMVTVTLLVYSENGLSPAVTKFISNYPNPFNPITTISFSVTQTSPFVNLEIFNLKGQKVKSFLINQLSNSPVNQIIWNGTDENNQPVSSGIYFYRLKAGNDFSETKRMLLLK